jgi:putative ABC transport system permease protein
MNSLDLRQGWRALAKTPLTSMIAVFSLAAGLGVTSVVYSVLDGLFLRPLSCARPREMVRIEAGGFSYPEYEEFQRQCRRLSGVLAETGHGGVLRDGERSSFVLASSVSPNFFSVLELRPELGRFFAEREDGMNHEPVAVISHALWRRFFAGDTNVYGRTVLLGDAPLTVVGVAPKGFRGVGRYFELDLWYPDGAMPSRDPAMRYTFRAYTVMGRLAPGVSRAEARAEAETIVRRVMPGGQTGPWTEPVRVLSETEYGLDQGGLAMLIVMPVVALVLLVACANVSGLLLARNEQRRQELALRSALGASRARLIRQLMTESLILAMGGLTLALPLTYMAVGPVSRMILSGAAGSTTPSLPVDHRALIVTFLIMLLATLVAGGLPALRSTRTDLATVLKGETPVLGFGRWRFAGRNLLVTGQLALTVVFLAATGLLLIGFGRVLRMDPGFTTRELLVVSFYGTHHRSPEEVRAYYRGLEERLQGLPGIGRVSLAVTVPYADVRNSLSRKLFVPRSDDGGGLRAYEVRGNIVATNYFETLGIRRLQGRGFGPDDRTGSPPVVMVSESLARTIWPDRDPIGQVLHLERPTGELATVIGVVGDIRQTPMEEQYQPFVYLPFEQESETYAYLLVATRGKASSLTGLVRQEMGQMDRTIVPWRIETLREGMWRKTSNAWALVGLMVTLSSLICLLSVSGLYGLVAYSVACRRQEFGIRMALGAQRRDTLWLVLRHGLLLGLSGSLLGSLCALAVGGVMRYNLPGVPGTHLPVLIGSAVLVILVALIASWVPGCQASRVEPMRVLRCDR